MKFDVFNAILKPATLKKSSRSIRDYSFTKERNADLLEKNKIKNLISEKFKGAVKK